MTEFTHLHLARAFGCATARRPRRHWSSGPRSTAASRRRPDRSRRSGAIRFVQAAPVARRCWRLAMAGGTLDAARPIRAPPPATHPGPGRRDHDPRLPRIATAGSSAHGPATGPTTEPGRAASAVHGHRHHLRGERGNPISTPGGPPDSRAGRRWSTPRTCCWGDRGTRGAGRAYPERAGDGGRGDGWSGGGGRDATDAGWIFATTPPPPCGGTTNQEREPARLIHCSAST